jgi:D-glucosaminate-6-phosphate ammonia-lyase
LPTALRRATAREVFPTRRRPSAVLSLKRKMTRNSVNAGDAACDVFRTFSIRRVINCCGIYTDLGGSVLSPSVWQAVEQLNTAYVRMTDLLDAASALVAKLTGAEAARITPGASAAITLAIGATIARGGGPHSEQLPDTRGLKSEVIIASSHLASYKYGVCIRMCGARLTAAGSRDQFDLGALTERITDKTACVFVPAHLLDGFSGTELLREVVESAHARDVPVVVDAAYMCYPTSLIAQFPASGADLTCFSAKYFFGPNSGGFVIGRKGLIKAVEGLDFTRFESGPYRKFGRPFKMSRYDVASTALALREWMTADHESRWAMYRRRVQVLLGAATDKPAVSIVPLLFTMTEDLIESDNVNCLALTFTSPSRAAAVSEQLEKDDPIIATIVMGNRLVISVDALLDGEERIVAERLSAALDSTL